MYKIYFISPAVGEVIVSIIQGKQEAYKKLKELKNKKDGRIYLLKPYKWGQ